MVIRAVHLIDPLFQLSVKLAVGGPILHRRKIVSIDTDVKKKCGPGRHQDIGCGEGRSCGNVVQKTAIMVISAIRAYEERLEKIFGSRIRTRLLGQFLTHRRLGIFIGIL